MLLKPGTVLLKPSTMAAYPWVEQLQSAMGEQGLGINQRPPGPWQSWESMDFLSLSSFGAPLQPWRTNGECIRRGGKRTSHPWAWLGHQQDKRTSSLRASTCHCSKKQGTWSQQQASLAKWWHASKAFWTRTVLQCECLPHYLFLAVHRSWLCGWWRQRHVCRSSGCQRGWSW